MGVILANLTQLLASERVQKLLDAPDVYANRGNYIVYPESEQEIAAVLSYAWENGLTVIPEGGGTKRGYGGINEQADITLSLSQYRGIVEHSEGDMTMTVRAGTTLAEIASFLQPYQQMLPLDVSHSGRATIGGVVASGDSGPKRLRYGSARDLVIGTRVVYPDGRIIRTGGKVVKNVAGYDMNKLFAGSMGTLGVLSEITLKLRPLPAHRSTVLVTFSQDAFSDIRSFAVRLMDSMLEPVSLELLSPALNERLGGKPVYSIAIALEDVEKAVFYQEDWIQTHCPHGAQATLLSQEQAAQWWADFYGVSPCGTRGDNRIALKFGSKNMDVLDLIFAAHQWGYQHNRNVEAHGGLGHGISHAYVDAGDQTPLCVEALRTAAKEKGGYAIVQHAPLAWRRKLNTWGDEPSYMGLLRGIKNAVDPKQILNPNRFVGGI